MSKSIHARIIEFHELTDIYRNNLTQEGMWLFVATLGCWGLTANIYFQYFAFCITGILFAERFHDKISRSKNLARVKSDLIKDIDNSDEGSEKQTYLKDYKAMLKDRFSINSMFTEGRVFFICFMFWGVSLAYQTIIFWLNVFKATLT